MKIIHEFYTNTHTHTHTHTHKYILHICMYIQYLFNYIQKKSKNLSSWKKERPTFLLITFTFKVISGIQVPQRQALTNYYLACNYKIAL